MRTCVLLFVLLAAPALAAAGEGAPRTGVLVRAKPAQVVPGEAFDVILVVGYDHVWFEQYGAPLFRRPMDVPLQVTLPWLEKPEGAVRLPDPESQEGPQKSLVLNGEVVPLTVFEVTNAPGHTVTRLGRRYRFLATGDEAIAIPAPTLRYAHADAFEEDFLGERVALDPKFAEVGGEPLAVAVRAYPEPVARGFTGAVGPVRVEASIDRERLRAGEALRLTLRFRGADNLTRFDAPALDSLEGFEVRGIDDDRGSPERTVVYELVPRGARVKSVPPIRFAYLRPQLPHGGQYVVTHTRRLPLIVLPGPTPVEPAVGPEPDRERGEEQPLWPYALVGALAGALAVWAVGRRRRRRAAPAVGAGLEPERIAEATAALEAAADDRSFAAFLAAHLGCSAAAVVGPGLAERLEVAGVGSALAARAAQSLRDLQAARYGGASATLDPGLVRELQSALTT